MNTIDDYTMAKPCPKCGQYYPGDCRKFGCADPDCKCDGCIDDIEMTEYETNSEDHGDDS